MLGIRRLKKLTKKAEKELNQAYRDMFSVFPGSVDFDKERTGQIQIYCSLVRFYIDYGFDTGIHGRIASKLESYLEK